jgi:hypothetical protein
VCDTNSNGVGEGTVNSGCLDLRALVPTYLASIPSDPSGTQEESGYLVQMNPNNQKIGISAISGEFSDISINYIPSINRNSIVLELDPADIDSYLGTGTSWLDLTDNDVDGTLTNGVIFNSSSPQNFSFDGVDDFVELGNPAALDIVNEITHNLWIYIDSNYANGFNGVLTKANSGSAGGSLSHTLIYIDSSDHFVARYGRSNGSVGQMVLDTNLTLNTWINYTVTYDGQNIRLYKNGGEIDSAAQTGTIYNTNQDTGVKLGRDGRFSFDSGRQFHGDIGYFSVYDRALTAQEVELNFEAIRTRFGL